MTRLPRWLVDIANATKRPQRLYLTSDWREARPWNGLVTIRPGDKVEDVLDQMPGS